MIYAFLANGFEEIEALTPVDFLLRLGECVKTVGVTGKTVKGSHGITVEADLTLSEISLDENLKGIILPGGMPGAKNLNDSKGVQNAIDYCSEHKRVIGAICAAPFILGRKNLLKGKNATCFPGFESDLKGANVVSDGVVISDNIVTARGAGVAWEFSAALGSLFSGEEESQEILRGIQWKK
ncbi:MAG: DJ-1 family glyoxalase III [Acutalibacteraceae bacterium]